MHCIPIGWVQWEKGHCVRQAISSGKAEIIWKMIAGQTFHVHRLTGSGVNNPVGTGLGPEGSTDLITRSPRQ